MRRPTTPPPKITILIVWCLLVLCVAGHAQTDSFTNHLAQATAAEARGHLSDALRACNAAAQAASNNVPHLCTVARKYCDLTYLTNSSTAQKALLQRALECSLRAVLVDSNSATAHASVAVCYAKLCTLSDIKTELAYSRLFKLEAEKAIAFDPKQDIAYYLLGRWNYGIASLGLLSRTYVSLIYGGLPQASYADAITNFKQAIQLAPSRLLYHAGLAMAYEATGQRALEIAELHQCRDLKSSAPEDQAAQKDALKKLAALGQ